MVVCSSKCKTKLKLTKVQHIGYLNLPENCQNLQPLVAEVIIVHHQHFIPHHDSPSMRASPDLDPYSNLGENCTFVNTVKVKMGIELGFPHLDKMVQLKMALETNFKWFYSYFEFG